MVIELYRIVTSPLALQNVKEIHTLTRANISSHRQTGFILHPAVISNTDGRSNLSTPVFGVAYIDAFPEIAHNSQTSGR